MRRLCNLLILILLSCSGSGQQTVTRDSHIALVENFVAAYNQHDVETLLTYVASDAAWFSINGATLGTEASNSAELEQGLTAYFSRYPTARSEITTISRLGRFITTHERAIWDSGTSSQSSVAVYEVSDSLIQNVWYFPAVRATNE